MQKILYTVIVLFIAVTSAVSQVRVGGMLGYGSEVEQLGIGVNAEFHINDKMSLAPNLFFYLPEKTGGVKLSYWELNADFHYYFLSADVIGLYGLGGLNLTTAKFKADDTFLNGREDSHSELGLNLGLGANFDLGTVIPFAELKYVAGDADQAVVFFGVKVPIGD